MAIIRDIMPAFELFQPATVGDALGLLDQHRSDAWVLAPGQVRSFVTGPGERLLHVNEGRVWLTVPGDAVTVIVGVCTGVALLPSCAKPQSNNWLLSKCRA